MRHPRRTRKSSPKEKNSALTVEQGLAMALVFLLFAATVEAAEPAWWTASGGPIDGNPANDYAVANEGQLKQFTQKAVIYLNANVSGGAGTNLNSIVTGWSNYYATNGYSSTNPAPGDFAAANVGQLKYVGGLVYAQLSSAGFTGLYPSWLVINTNSDYSAANLGQLKTVFDFDVSVAPGSVTGLTAVSYSPGQVYLSWTPPSPNNATAITIQRSIDGGTTWTTLTGSLDPLSANFTDNAPSSGSAGNQYSVTPSNPAGSAPPDTTSSLVVISSPVMGLTGTLNNSGTMALSWMPVTGAANYVLQRKVLDGSHTWTTIATPTDTNYLDDDRDFQTGYRYQVSVTNSAGGSTPSLEWPQQRYSVIDLGNNGTPFAVNNSGTVASINSTGTASIWSNGTTTPAPTGFNASGKGHITEDGRIAGSVPGVHTVYGTPWNPGLFTNTINYPAIWSVASGTGTQTVDNASLVTAYKYVPPFYQIEISYDNESLSPSGLGSGDATVHFMGDSNSGMTFYYYDTFYGGFVFNPFSVVGAGQDGSISGTLFAINPVEAINDTGTLIGTIYANSGGGSGFVSSTGSYTILGFTSYDINNAGLIVGEGGTFPNNFGVVYLSGTTTLGDYPAIKINNASPAQILDEGNQLWNSNNMAYHPTSLPDYMPDSGWTNVTVYALNDTNDFVATAVKATNGQTTEVLSYLNYITRDGQPISSTNGTVVVGQQINLTNYISGVPPTAISSNWWNIPGRTFKTYAPSISNSNYTNLAPSDLTNSFVMFYWLDGSTNRIVSCSTTIFGQTNVITTTLNVLRPSGSIMVSKGRIGTGPDNSQGIEKGVPYLYCGKNLPGPPVDVGIYFTQSIVEPHGFTGGTNQWLQVINSATITRTSLGSTNTIGTSGVDSADPSTFFYGYNPGTTDTSDSPDAELLSTNIMGYYSFNATMYLMWQPNPATVNGDNVAWVPLRIVPWNFDATATNMVPSNINGWGVQSSSYPSSTNDNDATNEPVWTQNAQSSWHAGPGP